MQQPGIKLLQLTAATAAGIAAAQAVAGAGNLTINGSLASGGVATLGVAGTNLAARRIIITSTSGSDGAVVFTVTGTNRYGVTQSETITGVTATPVQSQYDYQTVTQIAASGATAGNISAGTNTVASTEWVQWNILETGWFVGGAVSGGASTYTVEDTWDDTADIGTTLTAMPQQFATEAASQIPPHVFAHAGYSSPLTGDNAWDGGPRPCRATRVTVNTGTALVIAWFLQVGQRS